jgi:hypothetical protein
MATMPVKLAAGRASNVRYLTAFKPTECHISLSLRFH